MSKNSSNKPDLLDYLLEHDLMQQFVSNCDKLKTRESFFVCESFFWADSPEGHDFWGAIDDAVDVDHKRMREYITTHYPEYFI